MAALRDRVRRASGWAGGAHLLRQVLHLGTLLLLARWLPPAALGEYSLLLVVLGSGRAICDAGLGAALVQRERLTPEDGDTVFWASAALGLGLAGALALLAAPLASFFAAPALAPALRVGALAFFIGALGQVPLAQLQRALDFRRIGIQELAGQLVFSALALAFAAQGVGLTGFAVALVAGDGVALLGLVALCRFRPALRFSWPALRHALGFGGPVVGLRILNDVARRLDVILIGKLAGLHALGIYGMAANVLRMPEQQVGQLVKRVFFPALSSLQGNLAQLASATERLVASVALVSFPIVAGIALVFGDFVAAALPPHWSETVPLVRILAGAGALFAIGGTLGTSLWALGRPDVDFGFALLRLFGMAALLALAAPWGARGVAFATLAYTIATLPLVMIVVERLLGLSVRRVLRALWPAVYATAAMIAGVVAFQTLHAVAAWPALVRLAAGVGIGASCYVGVLLHFRDPMFVELVDTVRGRIGSQVPRGAQEAA